MASQQQVREYLAYWFQLGKKIVLRNGMAPFSPSPIVQGDRYSPEFEDCWRSILTVGGKDCYLEGTDQTIEELLSPTWELEDCARCEMPIPLATSGMPAQVCPCNDLPLWPNEDLPEPRAPVSSLSHLTEIRARLESVDIPTADRLTADTLGDEAVEEPSNLVNN